MHRKAEEEGNKRQRSRRAVERRLWSKERNKIEIIVLGKANIFLLSDADNNDKALVKINHDNNKGEVQLLHKGQFLPSVLVEASVNIRESCCRLRAGKAVNVFPDPQIIIRNGILPFAENEVLSSVP